MDFFAIYDHVIGCRDSQADLIASDAKDGDSDIGTNTQGFIRTAAENQH